ncbi:MAG: hypothetical protein JXB17_01640, partial [Bacteroidales bacterium]|nr:hypothetical protein [Bacteroidales bacterium]
PRDNPGFLYTIGELHGIEGIEKNRRIEFLPYTVGKFKTYEKEKGNPYADGFDPGFSVGIDGKIGITSNFTLDYSVNPDFGQVEADPSNLNLTVFETYYDEKRPFFLEGRNIFNYSFTDNQLFYSRRIGHAPSYNPEDDLDSNEYSTQPENTTIISAIKLSGKTKNGLSLGIIESLTSQEFTKISKNDIERKELAEPLSNYFIGRVQKDINQSNTIIGGMITAVNRNITEEQLNSLNKSAYTGGFDLRHHWKDKTYYIDAKTVFSHISGHQDALLNLQNASSRYYQRPDAKHLQLDSSISSLSGHGGNIEIGKGSNGKLRFSENINWRSPGLEMNDLGFQQSADNINNGTSIQFVQDDPVWKLRSFSINFYQENNWDFSGKYINSGYYLNLNTFTENKWFIYANLNRVSKQFDTKLLRGGSGFYQGGFWCQSYGIETDASKKVSFRINYHFHFHDDRLSRIDDLNPGMTIKISNILILSPGVSLSKHKIGFQYLDTLGINENKKYILAQLERKILSLVFRADLAITPEITIQYYYNPYFSTGKYSNFKLVVNPGQKNIENQYRLIQLNTDYIFDGSNYQFTENIIGEGKNNIEYPDFFYFESHSNFVFRWEYKPGSTLYFVWTRSGSSDVKLSETSPTSQNIFLFKLNYWFSL